MTDVGVIEWREPGPAHRGFGAKPGVWEDRLRPLMHHPQRWAVVLKCESAGKATNMAASLRGPKAKIPAGKWEFAARNGEVFARYIGPE